MKLFDILPPNLFSILTSKNKLIYTDALFVLRRAFKQEMTISKTELISMLIANLEEEMLDFDIFEENEGDEIYVKEDISLSSIAHRIVRRFEETGWIEIDYGLGTFDEYITLPDYSIKIINLLYSLTDDSIKEYDLYVYTTYSTLKTADTERDEYMYRALSISYERTMNLIDELKTLYNNIRRYHQALNEYITVNDILKGHFDEYKNLVGDRIYHRVKTLDSVPRYKAPILKILSNWLTDHTLRENMANQAMLRGQYKTKEDAMEDIIFKIQEIMDIYENVDQLLDEIDMKNSSYTRASIEKIQYLLNTDRSIKGKLVEILKKVSSGNEGMIEPMEACIELYSQRYIDENSLYVYTSQKRRDDTPLMKVQPPIEENGKIVLDELKDQLKSSYSRGRIMKFMKNIMDGVDVIYSSEIPLNSNDDFILLILAFLYCSANTFYDMEFMDEYVVNGGYRIPQIRFIRKDKKAYVARRV